MKPCNVIQNGMLFQQNKPIVIWGKAEVGEKVYAVLKNKKTERKASCVADASGFRLCFEPLKASFDPFTLHIFSDASNYEFSDILIGELWLSAGQSNMQFDAGYTLEFGKKTERAKNESVRIMTVLDQPKTDGDIPREYLEQSNVVGNLSWVKVDDWRNVKNASAIGLEFALYLSRKLKVPVGILGVAVGGSSIDSWFSREMLEKDDFMLQYLKKKKRYMDKNNHNSFGKLNFTQMSGIYNERIAPLADMNIRGVIWYQGESNVGDFADAQYFEYALKELLVFYRVLFENEGISFICSQIASYNYNLVDKFSQNYINEAIEAACRSNENAFCVGISDIPYHYIGKEPFDWQHPIHPVTKKPVAQRMAKLALCHVYSIGKPYGFSTIESCTFTGGKAMVALNREFGEIHCSGKEIIGFAISGEDGIFHKADAQLTDGFHVEVYSQYVSKPTSLCYGFYNFNIECNLYNSCNLPVIAFRTDKEDTQTKKYLSFSGFSYLSIKNVFECCGHPSFGASAWKPTWTKGTIFCDSKVKLKHTDTNELHLRYETNKQGKNYLSLSPIVNYCGYPHCIENFKKLSFKVNNGNKLLELSGLDITTRGNEHYKFYAEDYAENYIFKTADEYIPITIDLSKAININGESITVTSEILKNIYLLQLTFLDDKAGELLINEFVFHN